MSGSRSGWQGNPRKRVNLPFQTVDLSDYQDRCATKKRVREGNVPTPCLLRNQVQALAVEMQESCITRATDDGSLRWRKTIIGYISESIGYSGEVKVNTSAGGSPSPRLIA